MAPATRIYLHFLDLYHYARATLEGRARRVVERMTLALQAALLARAGHDAVSDAFCASRLGSGHGGAFGTLPASTGVDVLIERSGFGP